MDTNWQDLIKQLRTAGWSMAAIAREVGAPPSTIGDLATGRSRQPRGVLAIKLHKLATERTETPT